MVYGKVLIEVEQEGRSSIIIFALTASRFERVIKRKLFLYFLRKTFNKNRLKR